MPRQALVMCLSIVLFACSSSPPTDTPQDDASTSQGLTDTPSETADTTVDRGVPQADASTSQGSTDTPSETIDAAEDQDATPRSEGDVLDAISSQDAPTPTADVSTVDSATEEADSQTPDTSEVDAQQGDSGPTETSCEGILDDANALLHTAGSGCGAPDSCMMFEFPICGSFGCFRGAIRKDLPTEALSGLEDTALAGMHAGCEPFHCGCDFPIGTPVCLQEQCRMCPGDCGDSCEDVQAAVLVAAAPLAVGCESDDDCAVLVVQPCDLGDAIQCHGLPHRIGADVGPVQKLLDGMEEVGCSTFQCDCQLTESTCSAGTCVPSL